MKIPTLNKLECYKHIYHFANAHMNAIEIHAFKIMAILTFLYIIIYFVLKPLLASAHRHWIRSLRKHANKDIVTHDKHVMSILRSIGKIIKIVAATAAIIYIFGAVISTQVLNKTAINYVKCTNNASAVYRDCKIEQGRLHYRKDNNQIKHLNSQINVLTWQKHNYLIIGHQKTVSHLVNKRSMLQIRRHADKVDSKLKRHKVYKPTWIILRLAKLKDY